MSKGFSMAPLGTVVMPIDRSEVPLAGTEYRQLGVKLWGGGAYERESIDGSQTKYKTLSRVEADDIIVNKIWARNGSVAVVSENLTGCYVSSEFPTFVPIRGNLYPRWFHWLTKTEAFWEQCNQKSYGTSGKNRIRPERFLEIEIPLPSLSEQQRIVVRIEELAAKIKEARGLRRQAVEKTEAVIGSIAGRLLTEVHAPVTELHSWLDQNCDGIQTGPFGAQLGSADFIESGIPVLTIGNVQYGGLKLNNLKYVSEKKARQLDRYRIKGGDILFARMGTVGRCCIVPEEAQGWLINYHIIRVALDKLRVEPHYIYWIIRASTEVVEHLDKKIRGATRQGVNSAIVRALPCRVPPLPEQRRILAYLDDLQAKVDVLKLFQVETAAELDALMPALLDKAFKGEL